MTCWTFFNILSNQEWVYIFYQSYQNTIHIIVYHWLMTFFLCRIWPIGKAFTAFRQLSTFSLVKVGDGLTSLNTVYITYCMCLKDRFTFLNQIHILDVYVRTLFLRFHLVLRNLTHQRYVYTYRMYILHHGDVNCWLCVLDTVCLHRIRVTWRSGVTGFFWIVQTFVSILAPISGRVNRRINVVG